MNMPGQYNNNPPDDDANNNIRYGRIPQRVPRRHKTLKRVECVSYLCIPPCTLNILIRFSPSITQALPRQFCA